MEDLLADIEAFTAEHAMSEWQFGEAVLNDRHFVRQLRDGRDIRFSTAERVRAFMRDWREPDTAPASAEEAA